MRCIFSISEEALEIRWRSLVRYKTNRCQQTRRHDEGHQQGSRTVESYTNHSVRATAITLWSNAGVQNRHIMAISGHRSKQSLAHLNTRPSTSQLQQCSDALEVWTPKIPFFWQSDKRPHPNSRTQHDDNGNVKQLSWIALQQLHGTRSTCARHFGLRFQPGTLTWVFYFYLDLRCKSSTHFWLESAFKMHSPARVINKKII